MREIKKLIIHAQEVFMITQERLKELFYYNKTIGLFDNLSDAVLARINAEGINGYHINHGREKGVL